MREIVHLQAGQCGNQIGAKVSLVYFLFFRFLFIFFNFFVDSYKLFSWFCFCGFLASAANLCTLPENVFQWVSKLIVTQSQRRRRLLQRIQQLKQKKINAKKRPANKHKEKNKKMLQDKKNWNLNQIKNKWAARRSEENEICLGFVGTRYALCLKASQHNALWLWQRVETQLGPAPLINEAELYWSNMGHYCNCFHGTFFFLLHFADAENLLNYHCGCIFSLCWAFL